MAAPAYASPSVKLEATLAPEHLGQSATIGFGFQITERSGRVPPPLTEVDLRYPNELGIAVSGLGVASCPLATVEALGPPGCPVDSLMGYGSAITEIPVGSGVIRERAKLTLLRGPTEHGHLALLIHASGSNPVITELTFPALLLPSQAPFGELLRTRIPLIPSLPGAPDVAVVRMHATLGPSDVLYTERVGNTVITYRPPGILLPESCPHKGFPFAASLSFLDGSRASAHTTVRCPRPAGR